MIKAIQLKQLSPWPLSFVLSISVVAKHCIYWVQTKGNSRYPKRVKTETERWKTPQLQFAAALAGAKPQQYSLLPGGQITVRAKQQLCGSEYRFNVQRAGMTFNTGTQ